MRKFNNIAVGTKLEIIHAIKIIIAVLLGFIAIHIDPDPHAVWIIISIIIIMMTHASVSVQIEKAISRVIGTCVGATLGIVVILMHNNLITNAIILILVTGAFYVIRLKRLLSEYAALLGLVTFTMVIVAPNATWLFGVARAGEIIIGIIISLLVSLFIYPITSNEMLKLYLEKNWQQIIAYTQKILVEDLSRNQDDAVREIEYKILQRHSNIEQLLRIKPISKRHKTQPYLILLSRYQLGIYRYITLIDVALHSHINAEQQDTINYRNIIKDCSSKLIYAFENINSINADALILELEQSIKQLKQFCKLDANWDIPADVAIIFNLQRIIILLHKYRDALTISSLPKSS
jgi:uncharacterized membrane protein YccC